MYVITKKNVCFSVIYSQYKLGHGLGLDGSVKHVGGYIYIPIITIPSKCNRECCAWQNIGPTWYKLNNGIDTRSR